MVSPIDKKLEEIVGVLKSEFMPARLFLFGSRASGNARPDSDYDLILNKSTPLKRLSYSGVIVEKTEDGGYTVNGYDLVDSSRVIFAADADADVRNKIWVVNFIVPNS